MGELRILTSMNAKELREVVPPHMLRAGDTKVIFDPDNEDEVEVAEDQFKTLIERGFTAYEVDKKGNKSSKATKFDPEAGKYILVPPIAGG